MTSKRVAVIGAGPSGLVTVKELLEQGHRPVCFERASSLGGVFRFDEKDGVVWESCRLTSSGLLTAFSDFPVSKAREEHMPISEYVAYLREYAESFGVEPHVRYGVTVSRVLQLDSGEWEVCSTTGSTESSETFDSVAVCSGLHQHPYTPEFPGQDSFTGKIMHASQYRRNSNMAGKKVLVVGAGESGADIAAEVADKASEAVLSLRRGVAVVPRCAFGKPRDYLTSRVANGASHWLFQTRNPADGHKRKVYRLAFFPVVILDKLLQWSNRFFWENLPLFFSFQADEIRTRFMTRKLSKQLLQESGGTLMEQFGTKDDRFVRSMAVGKCRRVPAIKRYDTNQVVFEDGSTFAPDLVLFCTGFETKIPYLDASIANTDRYLNTFSPQTGGSLGFIGFVRPGFGAIPPLAELQARWFALIQSGVLELPSEARMVESIRNWEASHRHIFRATGERLSHLVDYTVYCDELAEQIGCKPRREYLARESRKFRTRFYAGPLVAAQYRLSGPGACPSLVRKVIEGLPLAHPTPDLVNFYLRWTMCRILYRVMGSDYAPKLSIR